MKKKYLLLSVITLVTVVIDQLTKWWAKGLQYQSPIRVIDNFFDFIYVENPGAAWGMMGNLEPSVRIPLFVLISIVAVGFIGYFFHRLKDDQSLPIWALSLVFGGAMGNFIDRIYQSFVIDFIDWHYHQYHWPTFNMADVFISVGVVLLAFEMFFGKSEFSLIYAEQEDKPDDDTSTKK